jgi:sugar lactone lactonase YvrE
MADLEARCACHLQLELGEGVRWDDRRRQLAWVDLHRGRLFTAPVTGPGAALGEVTELDAGGPLTAVVPLPHGDGWLAGHGQGLALLDRDGLRELVAPERRRPGHTRVNDAACDRDGRLWLGSMEYAGAPGAGHLYRLDLDGRLTVAIAPTTISNGLGWSPDGATMYFVDSGPGTITALDYHDGEPTDPRVVVRIDEGGPVPDGLCVDDDGCLWVAVWGAGEVRRYAPEGPLLARVGTPASRPSSCAFGGPDRDVLFITTARVELTETVLSGQPHAGCLLAAEVGVAGPAAAPYRGPLEVTDAT